MSVGGGRLAFPRVVLMLFDCEAFGGWPIHVAAESVGPGGVDVVIARLPSAICAVVVYADWMKTVGVAICSHVAVFFHLGASAPAIARTSPGVRVFVFIVGQLRHHGGNGGGEFLDFRLHR